MASISEVIDYDTAAIVAEEMGCKVEKEVHVTIEEQLFDEHEDKEEELQPRDPVVVVMGTLTTARPLCSTRSARPRSSRRGRRHYPAHRRIPR